MYRMIIVAEKDCDYKPIVWCEQDTDDRVKTLWKLTKDEQHPHRAVTMVRKNYTSTLGYFGLIGGRVAWHHDSGC